ncbi:MAG: hypothetical protein Q9208_001009 [Pyrenodesmia sp. 3 TL-2023]
MDCTSTTNPIPRSTSLTSPKPYKPTHILLFMHLGAQSSHILKYTLPLSTLYSTATIEIFTCSISEYLFLPLSYYQRNHLTSNPSIQTLVTTPPADLRLMVFAFSLAGAYQLIAFAHLYRKHHGVPLPVKLIVFDCSPAVISRKTTTTMLCQSAFLHSSLPSILKPLLQNLAAIVITIYLLILALVVSEPDPSHPICTACKDPTLLDINAKRLYMYSAADEWITEGGIEREIEEAEGKGWLCVKKRFEGVRHCQCVKKFGTYLDAVAKTWSGAVVVVHKEIEEEEAGGWG